jgi:hypothetical protein
METKEQLRAILETAVGDGIMIKRKMFIDSQTPSTIYLFPWSETARKKEPKEGQVIPTNTITNTTDSTITTQVI